jgi:hypothetical protein
MFDSLKAFVDELEELMAEFFPLATLETVYSRVNRSSLRLVLDADLFIDIYFNADNGRFDFTLIRTGKRVFGYDNLRSWHYHPAEAPDTHVKCAAPSLRLIFEHTARTVRSTRAAPPR